MSAVDALAAVEAWSDAIEWWGPDRCVAVGCRDVSLSRALDGRRIHTIRPTGRWAGAL